MNCKTCKADCARRGENREKEVCPGFIPMTNADYIRSMTDEELVELLHTQIGCGLEYLPCGKICDGKCNSFTDEDCKAKILEWLKQPYKE